MIKANKAANSLYLNLLQYLALLLAEEAAMNTEKTDNHISYRQSMQWGDLIKAMEESD